MFGFNVLFETNSFIIESRTIETTNETGVFEYQLLLLFFTSQISKGINDDTKNEIEYNNDDNEEEQQVINDTGSE